MPEKAPVICPWCGAEMTYYPFCTAMLYCGMFRCKCGVFSPTGALADTAEQAEESAYAAAMKRFEPMQKPLTLIDLEKCCETCDPVYVCRCGEDMPMFRGQTTIGAVLDIVPSYGQCEKVIKAIYGEKLSLCQSDYGRTWIAFRNKPTGDERKAAKQDE